MMLVTGGAIAGAGALIAAPFRDRIVATAREVRPAPARPPPAVAGHCGYGNGRRGRLGVHPAAARASPWRRSAAAVLGHAAGRARPNRGCRCVRAPAQSLAGTHLYGQPSQYGRCRSFVAATTRSRPGACSRCSTKADAPRRGAAAFGIAYGRCATATCRCRALTRPAARASSSGGHGRHDKAALRPLKSRPARPISRAYTSADGDHRGDGAPIGRLSSMTASRCDRYFPGPRTARPDRRAIVSASSHGPDAGSRDAACRAPQSCLRLTSCSVSGRGEIAHYRAWLAAAAQGS